MIRNRFRNSRPGPCKRTTKGSLGQDGYVRLVIPTGASSRAGLVMFRGVKARLAFESRGKPRAGNEGIMRDKQADIRRGLHIFIRTSFQLDLRRMEKGGVSSRSFMWFKGDSSGRIHDDVCHVQTGNRLNTMAKTRAVVGRRPRCRKNASFFAFAAVPKATFLAQVNEPAR